MPNSCDVSDAECERSCNTKCWRCGLPVCGRCSSVVLYLRERSKKRICNNCMREGIEHAESWACDKLEVPAPPLGVELSTAVRDYWQHYATRAYQRALAKRGV